jgi:TRAP-type C4-dicarboxylate transport system permease small subunit
MEFFRRLDRVWARGEGMLTVLVLLSMVAVAGFSAGIRNLTRFDVQWANQLLTDMEWADSFLRKATMWLAFLGASQATYYRKHISIDVLTRIAPLKQRYMMHAAAGLIAATITACLAYSLSSAVNINLHERPIEYEMLGDNGSKHVCDASAAELKNLEGVEVPRTFCAVRSVLRVIGITAETPGAAFQIIVPFMFIVISLRFLGIGIGAGMAVFKGEEAMLRLEQEEHERLAAVHAAVAGDLTDAASLPPPQAEPPPTLEPDRHDGHDEHDHEDEGQS